MKPNNHLKHLYSIFVLAFLCLMVSGVGLSAKSKAYLIGPGDVLTLTIHAGGEKQQQVDLTVSEEGLINVPFVGQIKAKDMTTSALEGMIRQPLAEDYFVDPRVNISIKEYHHLQYYISGAVKKPGLYELSSEITLFELIAKAEGVLPTRGNVAYIQRADAEVKASTNRTGETITSKGPVKVNLQALLDSGDMTHNPILHSGDVVYIPLAKALNLAESKVYVEGEVKKPGVYDYQPGLTALNACILAGGFGEFAAPNRARIIRQKGKEQIVIKIDLNEVKTGEKPDIELKPGDRVHVPETWL